MTAVTPQLLPKPCPWCGCTKEPTIRDGSTFRWRIVECAECGAGPGEFRSDNRFDLSDEDKQEALAMWNRRSPASPVTSNATPDPSPRFGEVLAPFIHGHPRSPVSAQPPAPPTAVGKCTCGFGFHDYTNKLCPRYAAPPTDTDGAAGGQTKEGL